MPSSYSNKVTKGEQLQRALSKFRELGLLPLEEALDLLTQEVAKKMDWQRFAYLGAHNLIPHPFLNRIESGDEELVTVTINSDNSIYIENASGSLTTQEIVVDLGDYTLHGLEDYKILFRSSTVNNCTKTDSEFSITLQEPSILDSEGEVVSTPDPTVLPVVGDEIVLKEEVTEPWEFSAKLSIPAGFEGNLLIYPTFYIDGDIISDEEYYFGPAMTNRQLTLGLEELESKLYIGTKENYDKVKDRYVDGALLVFTDVKTGKVTIESTEYATDEDIQKLLAEIWDAMPTQASDLENNVGYQTAADVNKLVSMINKPRNLEKVLFYGSDVSTIAATPMECVTAYSDYEMVIFTELYSALSDNDKTILALLDGTGVDTVVRYSLSGKDQNTIKQDVDVIDTLNIAGIYVQEFDYDHNIDRETQNYFIDYAHKLGMFVVIDSSNRLEQIFSMQEHLQNTDGAASSLTRSDFMLFNYGYWNVSNGTTELNTLANIQKIYDYNNTAVAEFETSYKNQYGCKSIIVDSIANSETNVRKDYLLTVSLILSSIINVDAYAVTGNTTSDIISWNWPMFTNISKTYPLDALVTKDGNGVPYKFAGQLNGISYVVDLSEDPIKITANKKSVTTIFRDLYAEIDALKSATPDVMRGASSTADGASGSVPAPLKADKDKYLKGDGTWAELIIPEVNVMSGATASDDGESGLVPTPETTDKDKFLRGDGTWAEVDLASVNNKITTLENTLYNSTEADKSKSIRVLAAEEVSSAVSTLENTLYANVAADKTKSIRDIAAEETAKIVAGADTSFDTLKEIADWIANHATSATSMNSDINTLKGNVSDLTSRVAALEAAVAKLQTVQTNPADTTGLAMWIEQ